MKISTKKSGDVCIITIEEKDANLSNSEQFKELMVQEIEKGSTHIILSFEKVGYLDSSFLGAVVAVLKKLLPLKGKLVLVHLNDDIKNLFELTRLDKVFELQDTVDNALKSF